MSERFSSEPLAEDRIAQAYPLVRMVAPGMTLHEWRKRALVYVHATEARPAGRKGTNGKAAGQAPCGMRAIRNRDGYIHGLFSYRVEADSAPPRLLVEHFIAFDLLARAELVATMLEVIDALARAHGCATIHTPIGDGALMAIDDPVIAWFVAGGHRREGDRMAKAVG